jgi:pentatricopeptide repeat protein
MPIHDVACWNAMLQGFVNCGQAQKALEVYKTMQFENVEPDVSTFVEALNACGMVGALEEGRDIQEKIRAVGLEAEVSLRRALNRMYVVCERKNKLRTTYGKLPRHDVQYIILQLSGIVLCSPIACEAIVAVFLKIVWFSSVRQILQSTDSF